MEEEISLRQLLEVLLRRKWLIVTITIAAVFASGVLSFLVHTPTYKARATLLVNLPEQMSMESCKIIIRDSVVLTKVIDRLQLDPVKFDLETLQEAIAVENPRDTNLLHINVKGSDPKLAQELANTVAEEFIIHIREKNQAIFNTSAEILKAQMDNEEKSLNAALESYKQFLGQPKGANEIQQEISAKTSILTDFKARLLTKEVEVESNRKGLEVAQAQLKKTPEKLVAKRSLVDDPFLQDVVRQRLNATPEETALVSIESEEINPIYLNLQQKINGFSLRINQLNAEEKIIRQVIAITQKDLEGLQVELAKKQAEQDKLLADINRFRANYNLLLSRHEEARMALFLERDARISIATPALEPNTPIASRKILNIAVAGVLGLMVSVFLAFFLEYWRNSAVPAGTDIKKGRRLQA